MRLWRHQTGLVGQHNQLRPVTRVDLEHGAPDMRLRGRWAHHQTFPELIIDPL
jgi:hypothetical protein